MAEKFIKNLTIGQKRFFGDIANFASRKPKALEFSKDSPRKAHKKVRRLFYKIDEIQNANEYYLGQKYSKEDDKYLKRGEFGELILYHYIKNTIKAIFDLFEFVRTETNFKIPKKLSVLQSIVN